MAALLVFGARNLGRAIAKHMGQQGWDVAAVARSEESLARVRDDIPDALGISADAASDADVEACVRLACALAARLAPGFDFSR